VAVTLVQEDACEDRDGSAGVPATSLALSGAVPVVESPLPADVEIPGSAEGPARVGAGVISAGAGAARVGP